MSDASPVATASILVLCSANQCRSPMARSSPQPSFRRPPYPGSGALGGPAPGRSPPSPGAISALASYGLEISGHRSHRVTVADLNAG